MKLKFSRQDSHKKKRIGKKWRRPKGLHSKMRLSKKGYKKTVSIGYGKKREREKDFIFINSINDLKKVSKEKVLLSAKIGLKKKIEIIKEALKKKIVIVNIKNPEQFLKKIEEKLKKKKEEKEGKKKKKEEKRKKREKKEKEKEKKEKGDELAEKIKKEEEKGEKDKTLTKKK